MEQPVYHRADECEMRHRVRHRRHEDGDAHRDDDDDGKEEEHGQVVRQRAHDRPRVAHLPDLVEGLLDIVHQHQHRIEHKDKSHAEEDAALRMYQITVHEAHDDISGLWLCRHHVTEPDLYVFIIAEATGDGKDHGEDGHDGQQRGISQGSRLCHHPFLRKEPDGEIELTINLLQKTLHDSLSTVNCSLKRKHCPCKPGSVPLARCLSFI